MFIVEPDAAVRDGLRALINTLDIPVRAYSDATSFLDWYCAQHSGGGCLLLEAELTGLSSFDLLRTLRGRGVDIPAIVLVSTSNRVIAEQALAAGATEIIKKPLLDDKLLKSITRLLHRQ